MIWLTLPGPSHTDEFGRRLVSLLSEGDIVALHGPMGIGKTHLVRAMADAAGVLDVVRSPTYTIAHEYRTETGAKLAHLDLYREQDRLRDSSWWADIEPTLANTQWAAIEWPAFGHSELDQNVAWHITLGWSSRKDHDARIVHVVGPHPERLHRLAVRS